MKNILIIGAGAMGSAFSVPCVENNNNVSLMGTHLEDSLIETIKSKNNFHPKLNISLPSKLRVEKIEKLDDLMKEIPDVLVVGVSSIGIDWFVDKIADKIDNKTLIINASKISGTNLINTFITEFDENYNVTRNLRTNKIDISEKEWSLYDVKIYNNNNYQIKKVHKIKTNFDYKRIRTLYSNLSSLNLFQLIE